MKLLDFANMLLFEAQHIEKCEKLLWVLYWHHTAQGKDKSGAVLVTKGYHRDLASRISTLVHTHERESP